MRLPDHSLSIHTPQSDPTPAARIIFHPPLYFYFEHFKHKQSRKKSLINSMYSGPRFSHQHHENLVLPFPPIFLKQILETIRYLEIFQFITPKHENATIFLKNVSQGRNNFRNTGTKENSILSDSRSKGIKKG